jgi:hypothetical protein
MYLGRNRYTALILFGFEHYLVICVFIAFQ